VCVCVCVCVYASMCMPVCVCVFFRERACACVGVHVCARVVCERELCRFVSAAHKLVAILVCVCVCAASVRHPCVFAPTASIGGAGAVCRELLSNTAHEHPS